MLIAVIMAMIRLKQHPSMQFMSLGAKHFRLDKPLSIKHLLRRNNKLFKYRRGKPITLALSKGKGDVPLYAAVEQ